MKRATIGIVSAVFLLGSLFLFSESAHAGYFRHRQIRQQKRIYHGVRQGQINPRELYRLEREQCRIGREKRRMQSDGTFTWREKAKLQYDMNRASRHIFRTKHNKW